MRKILFVIFCCFVSCKNKTVNHLQTKQEKAELAVKEYLHCSADSGERMKFTDIDNNRIGLINGINFHEGSKSFPLYKTVWFSLDTSCTEVKGASIN